MSNDWRGEEMREEMLEALKRYVQEDTFEARGEWLKRRRTWLRHLRIEEKRRTRSAA